jgi:hypothetical protein
VLFPPLRRHIAIHVLESRHRLPASSPSPPPCQRYSCRAIAARGRRTPHAPVACHSGTGRLAMGRALLCEQATAVLCEMGRYEFGLSGLVFFYFLFGLIQILAKFKKLYIIDLNSEKYETKLLSRS